MLERPLIVVVEDELEIRMLIEHTLEKHGYDVRSFEGGEEALRYLKTARPALILLDVMLPGIDGFEICRRIRSREGISNIPVMFLTARSEETDEVVGLEIGADDYIIKPFSPRVLVARIGRVIARQYGEGESTKVDDVIVLGDLVIDLRAFKVLYNGKTLALTSGEFKLLQTLAQRPGWVFSRAQLLEEMHEHALVNERAIDVQIVGLRRKLGDAAGMLQTVRGAGYRLDVV